jgi:putative thioredoxin
LEDMDMEQMAEQVVERQPAVMDVTDADFVDKVIEESKRRPVVVDLWASWCGPCRTLSPILERVAEQRGGQVLLAKIDVDANPYTAGQFGVQSIPTVIAFRDGKPVDGFIGAIPEPMVQEFVERLLPSEADVAAQEAYDEERSGDMADAERRYREILTSDPDNRGARLGLARILFERGEAEAAAELLDPLLPDPEAERLLARVRVARWAEMDGPGTLASAKRLAAQGRWREALDGMLGAIVDDPEARQAMLDVFAVLRDDDPLVAEYRRRLANALF